MGFHKVYGGKEEYAPGKKWCYAGWPSEKAANHYGIKYELLEKFIVGGISVPQEEMNDRLGSRACGARGTDGGGRRGASYRVTAGPLARAGPEMPCGGAGTLSASYGPSRARRWAGTPSETSTTAIGPGGLP